MQPIRREVKSLLCIGTFVNQTQTRKTCQNILQLEQALWTFVDHEGIEPVRRAHYDNSYYLAPTEAGCARLPGFSLSRQPAGYHRAFFAARCLGLPLYQLNGYLKSIKS